MRTYVGPWGRRRTPVALAPHELFSTGDAALAERLGTLVFGRHRLTARNGTKADFRATLHAVAIGAVTLGYLHLASPTDIELAASTARILVLQPMGARTLVRNGDQSFVATPERAAVVQPGVPTTMLCQADTTHFVIGIERPAALVQLSRLLGRALDRSLVFGPAMDLDAIGASGWNLSVELMHAELSESGSLLRSGIGQQQLEEFLISSLLYGHRSSYSGVLGRPSSCGEPRVITAARQYIDLRLSDPVSVASVALAAGVSSRTLQAVFRTELLTTPTAFIRSRRLDRARADLLEGDADTVTEIATRWGLNHLGRFAAEYRDRFGESPSQTLRRRRRTPFGPLEVD